MDLYSIRVHVRVYVCVRVRRIPTYRHSSDTTLSSGFSILRVLQR